MFKYFQSNLLNMGTEIGDKIYLMFSKDLNMKMIYARVESPPVLFI